LYAQAHINSPLAPPTPASIRLVREMYRYSQVFLLSLISRISSPPRLSIMIYDILRYARVNVCVCRGITLINSHTHTLTHAKTHTLTHSHTHTRQDAHAHLHRLSLYLDLFIYLLIYMHIYLFILTFSLSLSFFFFFFFFVYTHTCTLTYINANTIP
jgi:hypothetical protein